MVVETKSLLSNRVRQLRESLLDTKVRVSWERARHLKESYDETDGESVPMRRAKFFQKHLRERTVFIDDNPIVGTLTEFRCGVCKAKMRG